jgi:hypothetical protein
MMHWTLPSRTFIVSVRTRARVVSWTCLLQGPFRDMLLLPAFPGMSTVEGKEKRKHATKQLVALGGKVFLGVKKKIYK